MSDPDQDDAPLRFTVFISDEAQADLEAAYLYLSPHLGTEKALAWLNDFQAALYGLAAFPAPYANTVDEDATRRRGREVRRFLFR